MTFGALSDVMTIYELWQTKFTSYLHCEYKIIDDESSLHGRFGAIYPVDVLAGSVHRVWNLPLITCILCCHYPCLSGYQLLSARLSGSFFLYVTDDVNDINHVFVTPC